MQQGPNMKRREFLKASSAGLVGLLPLPLVNHHLLKASSQGPAPDVVWVENDCGSLSINGAKGF